MAIAQNFPALKPSLNLDFANTKALDSRITFARASTGAYYDGVTTAKAEENLLVRSQEFNTAWANTNISVTANDTTAPDGTLTADKIVATANGGNLYQGITTTTNIGNNNQIVNLTDGTLGTLISGSFDSITTTLVANGFYRINIIKSGFAFSVFAKAAEWDFIQVQLLFTSNTIRFYIYPAETSSSTGTADSTSGIYVWGAQAEIRSSATSYTPTTTQPITNYIPVLQTAPANTARFDHDPVTGESLGLLVEELRTNLLTYSEQFDDAAWGKADVTITANTIVAPDGTLTGAKIVDNTSNAVHWAYVNPNFTSGTAYTVSVYAKAAERTQIHIQVGGTSAFGDLTFAIFDLSTQTVVNSNNSPNTTITPVGNGWFRLTVSKTATATGSPQLQIGLSSGGSALYTGDGYSGIYIWGAQLESSSFSTSYIKTEASQVTRAADAASMTGANFSSWYRQDEGTLYVEASGSFSETQTQVFSLSDNTSTNRIFAGSIASEELNVRSVYNGTTQYTFSFSVNDTSFYRLAHAFSTNSSNASYDGAIQSEDTSCLVPTVDRLWFGDYDGSATRMLNGHIKKFSFYPARLTNTQLQALTS